MEAIPSKSDDGRFELLLKASIFFSITLSCIHPCEEKQASLFTADVTDNHG